MAYYAVIVQLMYSLLMIKQWYLGQDVSAVKETYVSI